MGEAKRLGRLRQQVLQGYPYCIYCGGEVPASTVDHVPPRAVVDGDRFEPACHPRHQAARSYWWRADLSRLGVEREATAVDIMEAQVTLILSGAYLATCPSTMPLPGSRRAACCRSS